MEYIKDLVNCNITKQITRLKKEERYLILFRIIIFFSALYCLYIFWGNSKLWLYFSFICILFIISSLLLNKLDKKLAVYYRYIQLTEEDKLYFNNSSEAQLPKNVYGNHPFADDLDIWGDNSLFSHLNRTVTVLGKKFLIDWVLNPHLDKDMIIKKQNAIKELSSKSNFKCNFRIAGSIFSRKNDNDISSFEQWLQEEDNQVKFRTLKYLLISTISINCIVFLSVILGFITPYMLINSIFFFGILSLYKEREIDVLHENIYNGIHAMNTYAELLELISKETFQSNLLCEWKDSLFSSEYDAIKSMRKGNSIGSMLDQRKNLMLHFLFEGIMGWQIIQILRMKKWKEQYKNSIVQWFEIIGQFDAAISLSVYVDRHPDYIFPMISEIKGVFEGKNLGNPLIINRECVTNDIHINNQGCFLIITGANMAGKSTYIRTVGLNLVLAEMGLPVYATEFSFYPTQIIASLRTSDSLSKNESYFFAELKKLKNIIDRLNNNETLFILLDEILKGTNSNDKLKGSEAFVEKLINHDANGIIATHDIKLGELENKYSTYIKNFHFSSEIQNDRLLFDYKLKQGIVSEFNATFLMRQMGIIN
ncbi:dNA mismatch repair protein MutS [Bacteroides sp. CAG:702]|nr:dNA mismatch repair protein MutS [Bacteroides sp. CAG:702]